MFSAIVTEMEALSTSKMVYRKPEVIITSSRINIFLKIPNPMHVFDTAGQAACFYYSSSGCSFMALKVHWNNAEIVLKQQWNTVKEACWLTNSRLSFRVVSDLFKSCFSPPSRLCHGCFGFLSASFQFHFSSNSWVQFSGDRFLVARTLRQAWTILEFSRTSCVMLFV